jgi:hypothetical protein
MREDNADFREILCAQSVFEANTVKPAQLDYEK